MIKSNSDPVVKYSKERIKSTFFYDINKDKLNVSSNNFEKSLLNHCIKKKTLRGRKTQNPLPKIQRCQICLEFKKYSNENIISCSVCNCQFHISCYKKPLNNMNNFKCERCTIANELNKKIEECKCFICSLNNGVLFYNEENDTFYHDICLKFIPEIYEETPLKLNRKNIRKWRFKCSCKYCNERLSKEKAVIKCNHPKCKHYYHIPCAIDKGMIFSIDYLYKYYCIDEFKDNISVPFYCSCHNKRLAGEYRKNVINNDNINDFKKENSEYNESTQESNFEISNFNCNMSIDDSNDDDNVIMMEKNKMFELNFNELLNLSDNINESNNYYNNNDSDDNISFYFENDNNNDLI